MNRFLARATTMLLLGSCIGCDQMTKSIAVDRLQGAEPIDLASGMLRLHYAENRGAFLGLGYSWPNGARVAVFVVLTAAVLLAGLWVVLRRRDRIDAATVGLVLMIGGGLGNLADRALQGFVVDFLNVGVGSLRTGIFNVADMAILAGALLLVLPGPGGAAAKGV